MKIKERNSNFELLRILATFMIIVLHYNNGGMGGALSFVSKNNVNYYFIRFIESACIISCNVFVLITGYFMNNKEKIRIAKVIHLVYLMMFYGIIISLFYIIFNINNINIHLLKSIIFSIIDRWFVIIYIILYLLIPFINKIIHHINKRQYKILLLILIIFFYIWPTFLSKTTIKDSGYGIINFVTLYLIGAYIKIYCDNNKSIKKSILTYFLCTVVTTIFYLFATRAIAYNSIFNLISAISLFETFKSINIKNNKYINNLASFTFSTYIIHENPLITKTIYQNFFHTNYYWDNKYLIFHLIITCICIYIICVVIEQIRRILMKKIIDDKIEKINYTI